MACDRLSGLHLRKTASHMGIQDTSRRIYRQTKSWDSSRERREERRGEVSPASPTRICPNDDIPPQEGHPHPHFQVIT